MARHFITVLGISTYFETRYYLNDKNDYIQTKYVQEALAHFLFKESQPGDKISILLTERAREVHYDHKDDSTKSLGDILSEFCNEKNIILNPIDISKGETPKEQWELFDATYNAIGEDDEITFDITHSFRSIPLLAVAVLNYARLLKNITITAIYYGAFDPSDNNNNPFNQIKDTHLWDISSFMDIMDWTAAAQSFISYGHGEEFLGLVKKMQDKAEDKSEYSGAKNLANSIYEFTKTLEVSRGKFFTGKKVNSIQKSYNIYCNCYERFNNNNAIANTNAFSNITKSIDESVQIAFHDVPRTDTNDTSYNLETGLASLNWYNEYNMVQQGLAALQETIITYICDAKDFKYNDRELNSNELFDRELISKLLNYCNKKNEKKNVNSISSFNFFINSNNDENDIKEFVLKYATEISPETDDNTTEEDKIDLATIMSKTQEFRNTISHFGFQSCEYNIKKLQDVFTKNYNAFIAIIEADKKEADNMEAEE